MTRFRLSLKGYTTNEYLVLIYRFLLLMLFYSVCRIIFFLFNTSLFPHVNLASFLRIMRGGVMFDTSAILYINALFILLCLLPFQFKFKEWYQKGLMMLFIITNAIGLALNSIDIIYYRFILKRTTASFFDIVRYDNNNTKVSFRFIYDYWYITLIWITLVLFLFLCYSWLKPKPLQFNRKWKYALLSFFVLIIVSALTVVGMRGGYMSTTRPINMNNAGKYVNSPEEMALVQNNPFCIMRTWGKRSFEIKKYFDSENEIEKIFNPLVIPDSSQIMKKENVVVIILESFSREFVGSLNKDLNGGTYKGYTPFLDSLISESLVFPNAFANGRKSIDAIPSVTASIPALVLPYVVSERSGNKINSIASLLAQQGYETSFFHGAPNGSM
jgi:phosphoglycerol transferase MdoB-like AlkP superfamily enzyme